MDKRPYFSKTVDELENIFEENIKDRAILIELQKELSYRSRVRSKELAKKVKAILDAPYQLDLPIDIQISGEYDRTATWYGTIGWYENRVEEFKNDKNELQKILYTLLSWNFEGGASFFQFRQKRSCLIRRQEPFSLVLGRGHLQTIFAKRIYTIPELVSCRMIDYGPAYRQDFFGSGR